MTYQINGTGESYGSAYMAMLYAIDAHPNVETRIVRSDGKTVTTLWPGQVAA